MDRSEAVFMCIKMQSFQVSNGVFHVLSRRCNFENRCLMEKRNKHSLLCEEIWCTSLLTLFLKLSMIYNKRINITFFNLDMQAHFLNWKKDYRQMTTLYDL